MASSPFDTSDPELLEPTDDDRRRQQRQRQQHQQSQTVTNRNIDFGYGPSLSGRETNTMLTEERASDAHGPPRAPLRQRLANDDQHTIASRPNYVGNRQYRDVTVLDPSWFSGNETGMNPATTADAAKMRTGYGYFDVSPFADHMAASPTRSQLEHGQGYFGGTGARIAGTPRDIFDDRLSLQPSVNSPAQPFSRNPPTRATSDTSVNQVDSPGVPARSNDGYDDSWGAHGPTGRPGSQGMPGIPASTSTMSGSMSPATSTTSGSMSPTAVGAPPANSSSVSTGVLQQPPELLQRPFPQGVDQTISDAADLPVPEPGSPHQVPTREHLEAFGRGKHPFELQWKNAEGKGQSLSLDVLTGVSTDPMQTGVFNKDFRKIEGYDSPETQSALQQRMFKFKQDYPGVDPAIVLFGQHQRYAADGVVESQAVARPRDIWSVKGVEAHMFPLQEGHTMQGTYGKSLDKASMDHLTGVADRRDPAGLDVVEQTGGNPFTFEGHHNRAYDEDAARGGFQIAGQNVNPLYAGPLARGIGAGYNAAKGALGTTSAEKVDLKKAAATQKAELAARKVALRELSAGAATGAHGFTRPEWNKLTKEAQTAAADAYTKARKDLQGKVNTTGRRGRPGTANPTKNLDMWAGAKAKEAAQEHMVRRPQGVFDAHKRRQANARTLASKRRTLKNLQGTNFFSRAGVEKISALVGRTYAKDVFPQVEKVRKAGGNTKKAVGDTVNAVRGHAGSPTSKIGVKSAATGALKLATGPAATAGLIVHDLVKAGVNKSRNLTRAAMEPVLMDSAMVDATRLQNYRNKITNAAGAKNTRDSLDPNALWTHLLDAQISIVADSDKRANSVSRIMEGKTAKDFTPGGGMFGRSSSKWLAKNLTSAERDGLMGLKDARDRGISLKESENLQNVAKNLYMSALTEEEDYDSMALDAPREQAQQGVRHLLGNQKAMDTMNSLYGFAWQAAREDESGNWVSGTSKMSMVLDIQQHLQKRPTLLDVMREEDKVKIPK
jgi:hypothetical protein